MPFDGTAPVHKCPHCGRFVDMATGFYARIPNAPEDDFVRLYCSEEHQQAHETAAQFKRDMLALADRLEAEAV